MTHIARDINESHAFNYTVDPLDVDNEPSLIEKSERVASQAEYDARPIKEFLWQNKTTNDTIQSWGRTDLACQRDLFAFCHKNDMLDQYRDFKVINRTYAA